MEQPRTLPADSADAIAQADPTADAGFALVEIVCVLAIIALLAAIILPAFPSATSRTRLEAYAVDAASLLKADHNAALRRSAHIATQVSAETRTLRSGATGRIIQLPADVRFDAMLASTCAAKRAGRTIDFFPSGLSCGGVVALSRPGMRYEVRVNWLTGSVEIVPQRQL